MFRTAKASSMDPSANRDRIRLSYVTLDWRTPFRSAAVIIRNASAGRKRENERDRMKENFK